MEQFQVTSKFNIFQCEIGALQIRRRQLPKFWDQALIAWAQIRQSGNGTDWVFIQPLFLNRNLNIESSLTASQQGNLFRKYWVCKRPNNFSSRRWHTAAEVKQKWRNLNVMICNCLVSKIPRKWRSLYRSTDAGVDSTAALATVKSVENITQ